jgi:hypothetical protein
MLLYRADRYIEIFGNDLIGFAVLPAHKEYSLALRRQPGKGSGLLIENIKTNCYCTTSFFDKGIIKARDSTVVIIRYDSTRTGIFQSTGIVTSNGSTEPILLILRGNVIASK